MKLIKSDYKTQCLRVPEINYITGKCIPDQAIHIDRIIKQYHRTKVHSYNSSKWWSRWVNCDQPAFDMILLANESWMSITDLCAKADKLANNLEPEGILFLAVNKYLLTPEHYVNVSDDYNLAILECALNLLKNYSLLEYEYHRNEKGDIGNFIIPDNRLVLCKKN